jgi:hypothetical protein
MERAVRASENAGVILAPFAAAYGSTRPRLMA